MPDKLDTSFFHLKATCGDFDLFWGNCNLDHISCESLSSDDSPLGLAIQELFDSIKPARKDLLLKCGYTEKDVMRANNIRDFLYLKPWFILKNMKPKWELLNMYLAVQDVLFTSSDEGYWQRHVSREIVSARHLLARDSNERKHLWRCLPVWKETSLTGELVVPENERDLHVALLEKIFDIAAKKHMSLDRWVKVHICSATPSIDERMAIVSKSGLTKIGERKLREIIELIIPDDFCRTFMPKSKAYCKAEQNLSLFQELLPEYKAQITPSFCRSFVNFVLPDYIEKIQLAKESQYQPGYIANITKVKSAVLFYRYLNRSALLNDLHSAFLEKRTSKLDLSEIPLFSLCGDLHKNSRIENDIIAAIRNYFARISTDSLGDDPRNYLGSRVYWASEAISHNTALHPAFLLYMVICCKRSILSGRDIEIPKQTKGPWYTGAVRDYPKQRNAQLMLLDELCEIFQLSQEDKDENLKQFLFWQGKEIRSTDESAYWQKQLGDDYARIPVIGFQLCCRAFLKDCLSPHFENLTYTAGSPLHLGGYATFWNNNQERIQEQAKLLGREHPDLVKEYAKLWNDPYAHSRQRGQILLCPLSLFSAPQFLRYKSSLIFL